MALGRVENLSPPQLTPTLVYSTLQSDIPLFRVTAAILLDGGGVALANSGAREVLLLAADGSLDNRAGGPGEGPGEFGEITTMVKALDGFLVYDARMGRMNEFTDSGDFVTSWSFGSGSRIVDLKPLARGIDGETLAIVGDSRAFHPGVNQEGHDAAAEVPAARGQPRHAGPAARRRVELPAHSPEAARPGSMSDSAAT